jgi:hypothetical protein
MSADNLERPGQVYWEGGEAVQESYRGPMSRVADYVESCGDGYRERPERGDVMRESYRGPAVPMPDTGDYLERRRETVRAGSRSPLMPLQHLHRAAEQPGPNETHQGSHRQPSIEPPRRPVKL